MQQAQGGDEYQCGYHKRFSFVVTEQAITIPQFSTVAILLFFTGLNLVAIVTETLEVIKVPDFATVFNLNYVIYTSGWT